MHKVTALINCVHNFVLFTFLTPVKGEATAWGKDKYNISLKVITI